MIAWRIYAADTERDAGHTSYPMNRMACSPSWVSSQQSGRISSDELTYQR